MNDEVKIPDRRGSERFSLVLEIEWEGRNGRFDGTVSDISASGCFVLTGVEVSDGETVKLYLPMGDGMKAQFSGQITNHEDEIGFAVRFDPLSIAQKNVLSALRAQKKD